MVTPVYFCNLGVALRDPRHEKHPFRLGFGRHRERRGSRERRDLVENGSFSQTNGPLSSLDTATYSGAEIDPLWNYGGVTDWSSRTRLRIRKP